LIRFVRPRRPEPVHRPLSFLSAGRSHAGGRPLNEDRYLDRPEVGLWAVADGMGGHQAGEVASGLVVEALQGVDRFSSGYACLSQVSEALRTVNRTLMERASAGGDGAVIGATVVALLIHDGHYACVWAGDSRAYLQRAGRLQPVTRDHSLVQELVDAGTLTPAESRTHRRANVVTRAVGVTEPLHLEMRHAAAQPGDRYLLCSDGLTNVVEEAEIEAVLAGGDAELAAEALLDLALKRGAKDNVTVVVVHAGAA
jgi:serine/threonine protein phosphatase PrpC